SGAEVTRRLLAADPAVRVLILSASGERQDVLDAMTAGATGYLVKSAQFSELLAAGRSTAAGGAGFTAGGGRAGAGGEPAGGPGARRPRLRARPPGRPGRASRGSPSGRPRSCAWWPRG